MDRSIFYTIIITGATILISLFILSAILFTEMMKVEERMTKMIDVQAVNLQVQAQRSDMLFEMFVDLLKEKINERKN